MKFALLALLMFIQPGFSNAKVIPIKTLNVDVFNDVWKRMSKKEIGLFAEEKGDKVFIATDDTLGSGAIFLNPEQAETLRNYLHKFEEWRKKATLKKTKLEKEIGTIESSDSGFVLNKEYYQGSPSKIRVSFFTQPNGSYQCVLEFGKIQSEKNQFISHLPETRYFSPQQAKDFSKALTPESIKSARAKAAKKKEIEDEFK